MKARNANRFRPMLESFEDRMNPSAVVDVYSFGDIAEGGSGGLLFYRSVDTTGAITVNYSIGGTATNGSDHALGTSGTIVFADGESTKTITLGTTDDVEYDPAETIVVTVTSGTGYAAGSTYIATITITDNEGTPVYWIGGYGASWSVGSNWSNNAVPDETTAVYFDSAHSNYGVTAPGSSGDLELAELHFVNGYSGTVRLESDLSVGKLELASADATLDQPSTYYGSDITVTAAMLWTDGTLNSTAKERARNNFPAL